jgi:hypothetical protein
VPFEQLAPKLKVILTAFKAERQGKELFGDYCDRVGLERLKALIV